MSETPALPTPDKAPDPAQHPREDGCFFCASDGELARALSGDIRRTPHMQLPEAACPYMSDELSNEDMFGTTCLDCGEPIDDSRPYAPTAEGELVHIGCGDPDELTGGGA